jgi:hypothetical protein
MVHRSYRRRRVMVVDPAAGVSPATLPVMLQQIFHTRVCWTIIQETDDGNVFRPPTNSSVSVPSRRVLRHLGQELVVSSLPDWTGRVGMTAGTASTAIRSMSRAIAASRALGWVNHGRGVAAHLAARHGNRVADGDLQISALAIVSKHRIKQIPDCLPIFSRDIAVDPEPDHEVLQRDAR